MMNMQKDASRVLSHHARVGEKGSAFGTWSEEGVKKGVDKNYPTQEIACETSERETRGRGAVKKRQTETEKFLWAQCNFNAA